jgi:hypothetical protein
MLFPGIDETVFAIGACRCVMQGFRVQYS